MSLLYIFCWSAKKYWKSASPPIFNFMVFSVLFPVGSFFTVPGSFELFAFASSSCFCFSLKPLTNLSAEKLYDNSAFALSVLATALHASMHAEYLRIFLQNFTIKLLFSFIHFLFDSIIIISMWVFAKYWTKRYLILCQIC